MIKDKIFRGLFIPAIGILIPYGAGLIAFQRLHPIQLIFTIVFFIFCSHLIWLGTVSIVTWLRTKKRFKTTISYKLSSLSLLTLLYGTGMMIMFACVWQFLITGTIFLVPVLRAAAITAVVAFVLGLVYEAVFLSAEVDLDEKVLQQLDMERLQAQANVLQNELDPHFLFNSLNTLSYLVRNDSEKAYQFVHKLSNVFKYLLLNKHKEFVTLQEEVSFLDDYYFLLRVRFDDGIQINNLLELSEMEALILPCTLQTLVENAMKHNVFSDKEPLVINLEMNQYYIIVSNPVRPKLYKANSTKTGLSNLKSRYKILTDKSIIIQKTNDQFQVKVPFQRKADLGMVSYG